MDGQIGQKTINAFSSNNRHDLILKGLSFLQGSRYIQLGLTTPDLKVFENGWFNRIIALT